MPVYRMPLTPKLRGARIEWCPKYRDLFTQLAPGVSWSLEKEQGRQWDQVIAENGTVLVRFHGAVPASLHLTLVKMLDVEVVSRG